MNQLDEILYTALTSDAAFNAAVGGRIRSTCFEVSPAEQDNVPLPSVIVIDFGSQDGQTTKDNTWESCEDQVQAGIEISASSPKEVHKLLRKARKAVAAYVQTLDYDHQPELNKISRDGVQWDWMKPCYFDTLRYQCTLYDEADGDE